MANRAASSGMSVSNFKQFQLACAGNVNCLRTTKLITQHIASEDAIN